MAVYLSGLIDIIVNLLSVLLIIYALTSFFLDPWHPARQFLDQLVQPILRPFRNVMPPVGMFDLSVMVALIVIQIAGYILKVMVASAF